MLVGVQEVRVKGSRSQHPEAGHELEGSCTRAGLYCWEETGLSPTSGSHVFDLLGSFQHLLLPLEGEARSRDGAQEVQQGLGHLLVR